MADENRLIYARFIPPGAYTFNISKNRALPFTERSPMARQIEAEDTLSS
jgi:hypothetical protein